MNDADADEIGIRNTPPNLVYSANDASSWFGSGILNKPIGDFYQTGGGHQWQSRTGAPYFGNVGMTIHSQFIPEPEQYALVFGLFALGFVFFRRHFKKHETVTSTHFGTTREA